MKYYKDDQNNVYAYESDGSQDNLIGNKVAMTVEEVKAHINPPMSMEQAIRHFKDMTYTYINKRVLDYDVLNNTDYQNIESFAKYAAVTTSSRHAISVQFIAWASNIWDVVNTYHSTLTAIPTDAEFKAVLDSVVF